MSKMHQSAVQAKATFHSFYVVMLLNYWLQIPDFSIVKLLAITNDYEISSNLIPPTQLITFVNVATLIIYTF